MTRIGLVFSGIALGVVAMLALPAAAPSVRSVLAAAPGFGWMSEPAKMPRSSGEQAKAELNDITLSPAQIDAAGITVEVAGPGTLQRSLLVPGTVIPSADRIARIAVRLLGSVAELRKRLAMPCNGTKWWR
jgi:cobalt-zinc-cadmium efflux system membrane fusion protein